MKVPEDLQELYDALREQYSMRIYQPKALELIERIGRLETALERIKTTVEDVPWDQRYTSEDWILETVQEALEGK